MRYVTSLILFINSMETKKPALTKGQVYFYKSILNEAVKLTFTENGKYDMVANILEALSDEKLKADILGEPMIYAFEMAMRNLPSDGCLTTCLHGSTMLLLEKEFLGRSLPI